jgi:hypothetical protein
LDKQVLRAYGAQDDKVFVLSTFLFEKGGAGCHPERARVSARAKDLLLGTRERRTYAAPAVITGPFEGVRAEQGHAFGAPYEHKKQVPRPFGARDDRPFAGFCLRFLVE